MNAWQVNTHPPTPPLPSFPSLHLVLLRVSDTACATSDETILCVVVVAEKVGFYMSVEVFVYFLIYKYPFFNVV